MGDRRDRRTEGHTGSPEGDDTGRQGDDTERRGDDTGRQGDDRSGPIDGQQEPIAVAADDDVDLYDVVTWEERTSLDGLAVALYWVLRRTAKAIVIVTALSLLVVIGGAAALTDPGIAMLTALSILPALALTAYVYASDLTTNEPPSLLFATFVLSILFAAFAAIVNTVMRGFFEPFGLIGLVLFFFLIVGPGEETVKLLAVWLYAYRDRRFDAVIDGAVYGAIAGLGFATIENSLYIARVIGFGEFSIGFAVIDDGGGITAIRALAGPGHVIYSAFAGYYLGLAKFNPDHRGPIILKGILIAAAIHATYNSTVGIATGAIVTVTGLPSLAAFFIYVIAFMSLFGLVLMRKLWRYNRIHRKAHDDDDDRDTDDDRDASDENRIE